MPANLRGLQTFCLAARHLSFKKAADALCLTASAVSHQISDLEAQLEFKLFHRQTRCIALTEKGEKLFDAVSPSLQAIDEAIDSAKHEHVRIPLLVQVPGVFRQ